MQLFYCRGIKEGINFLDPEESRHCTKVLRKKSGDHIQITDGLGFLYEAELTSTLPQKCSFHIRSSTFEEKPGYTIHIAIAPTKNADRMEWLMEKTVEIGIDKISFIKTAFSERNMINLERMRKKAISAMKQSVRTHLPIISGLEKMDNIVSASREDQRFLAHLENTQTKYLKDLVMPGKSYLILIGPEGGFSEDEIVLIKNKGFETVKISDFRLRTETAGMVACTILNAMNLQ